MIVVALLLVALTAGGENRLWWVDLELEGPLDEIRLDAGPDGATVVALSLVPGERRRLAVPLPVRSPLGAAALGTLSLPELVAVGEGTARWLGWSEEQPAERIERLPAALRDRPRPPLALAAPRAGLGELAVLVAFFVAGFALRRRASAALVVSLVGAAIVAPFAARGPRSEPELVLLELELAEGHALRVQVARDRLALPAERLEVEPAHARLELVLELVGDRLRGFVTAPETRLYGLRAEGAAALGPDANGLVDFTATWVRSADGAWSAHGAWRRGAALPAPAPPAQAGDPPGWLRTGIPPGRAVLLGRLESEASAWVRASGFGE